MTRRRWFAAAVVAAIAVDGVRGVATTTPVDSDDLSDADPGDCITVDMAVSSEKIALLTELADEFNEQRGRRDRRGVRVRPSVQQGVRRRGATHRRRLAEPGGQRHSAR